MRLKPRNLIDIKSSRRDSFRALPRRVNLHVTTPKRRLPLKEIFSIALICITVGSLFIGSVSAPVGGGAYAAENSDERKALETELDGLEKEIAQYNAVIENYRKQGQGLTSEIKALNAKVSKLNLQIKAINLSLSKLDLEINRTKGEITNTEQSIALQKQALAEALRTIYENDSETLIEILVKNQQLSDFFGDVDALLTVQQNLKDTLGQVITLRDNLVGQKESLSLERADAAAVKAYQNSQKGVLESTKGEKSNLLTVTKGQESKYQAIVADKKKKAAEIRSRIFRLLGGGELPFGEAAKLAKVAEQATGVRAAFILATLTQESAINGVIGANLGKCFYNDPRSNPSGTVMRNSEKPIFESLMAELGLDPAKTPVSCPIASDGAYGGAMGPAQFMPSTWVLYKDKVAQITGGKPSSPFNNLDAFTANALLLSDGLSACRSIFPDTFSQESCAAAKYYAGSKWRSYTSVGRYGYRVAERAAGFEDDIELITSN